jgi:hypothetical protein
MFFRTAAVVTAIFLSFAACASRQVDAGSSTSSVEESPATDAFVGAWAFEPGSTSTVSCPGGAPPFVTDLAAQQQGFVLTKLADASLHLENALGCKYDFDVHGHAAEIQPGQGCDKIPDGQGGFMTESLTRDTLTLSSDRIMLSVDGVIGPNGACGLRVAGTLARR